MKFRDNATKLLSASETMLIEQHGRPVGYFIPVKQTDEEETKAALQALSDAVQRAMDESGLSEDELAELFTIKRT